MSGWAQRAAERAEDGARDVSADEGIDWRGRALAAEAEVARLTAALRFLCRADTDVCDFCGATATKRSPEAERWGAWWCDVCAPPDAVDHEHAATLRPLLPPRGAK